MTLPVGGGPISRKRERIVQWLLRLRTVDAPRFALLPGSNEDVTEIQRTTLASVLAEMVNAGLYNQPKPYEVPMRLLALRHLVNEARRRSGG